MLLDMQVVCCLIEFSMVQISVQNLTMKRLRGYEIKVMDNRDNFKLLCNHVLCSLSFYCFEYDNLCLKHICLSCFTFALSVLELCG